MISRGHDASGCDHSMSGQASASSGSYATSGQQRDLVCPTAAKVGFESQRQIPKLSSRSNARGVNRRPFRTVF